MNESRRWLDDGAPREFERLFLAATSEQPPPSSVERALFAAGIAGAAVVTSSAVASSPSAATATSAGASAAGAGTAAAAGKTFVAAAAQWLAVGAISAGAVAASVAVIRHEHARAPASSASTVRDEQPKALPPAVPVVPGNPPPGTAISPPALPGESPGLESRSASAGTRAVSPPLHPHGRSVRKAPATNDSAAPARPLSDEMALVDSARSELRAGDALSVLRLAAEHARRFPDGSFAPEMMFLEMQAKLMVGRRESAADTARELVRRFPTAAQASRARELLESDTDDRNQ